jgi:ribosomal protein S18 acetylase RimI-like enzyme
MSVAYVVPADLDNPAHQLVVIELTDAYSRDGLGAGKPLQPDVKARLIPGLRAHPTTTIFLAYVGERAIGMALCFRGFSSFAAKPLINVHDLSVLPDQRGQGVGKQLLQGVIDHAAEIGCCKVTLETQEHNHKAQRLYRSLGFERQVHVEEFGGAIFMACPVV